MIEPTTVTVQVFNARCDRCGAPHDTDDYSDRDDLVHDLRVDGWELDAEDICPACLRRDALDRPNVRMSTYNPPT
jgi:hypothetical protein